MQSRRSSLLLKSGKANVLTWPQELGHPVQWMRTFLGMSSCCSTFATIDMALFLVSMTATPQYCSTAAQSLIAHAIASAMDDVCTYPRELQLSSDYARGLFVPVTAYKMTFGG